jgi:phosphate transport system protein
LSAVFARCSDKITDGPDAHLDSHVETATSPGARVGEGGDGGAVLGPMAMHISHTSRDFESELRELRAHSMSMGARCERSLNLALEAFWNNSPGLAKEVEALDRLIDRDEMEIDALVLRILALRQPVAYDLRVLAAALRLDTDLERIGDEAVNIAERAEEEHGAAMELARASLTAMAEQTQKMLRGALDAFVEGDVDSAEEVLSGDDAVDAQYGKVLRDMMVFMQEHHEGIPGAFCVMRVAKNIERVADHATNIAEEVIFMVQGEDVRHGSVPRLRASARQHEA